MKRTVVILAGVAALCVMAYYGSRLAAEPPKTAAPVPPPQTKVAVLNLSYVIKKYKKFELYTANAKTKLEAFDADLMPLKKELEQIQKEAEKEANPTTKEQLAKKFKEKNFVMQGKVDEYKKTLADFDAASFTTIYNDIKDMTARYAKSRGIELVFHYNDGTTDAEVNTAQNIGRKMSLGACFPMYVTQGMDISDEVLKYLNAAVASAPTTYTAPATGH